MYGTRYNVANTIFKFICSSTIGNKSETTPESGGEKFNTFCIRKKCIKLAQYNRANTLF